MPELAASVPEGVRAHLRALHYDTALRMHPVGIASALQLVDASRLLLGTDAPLRRSTDQIAQLHGQALPEETLRLIEGDNARRLLDRSRNHCADLDVALARDVHPFVDFDTHLTRQRPGLPPAGSTEICFKPSTAAVVRSAALALALRRSTMALGVPVGAKSPNQVTTSKPPTPASATVGTSGNAVQRVLLVTASSRTLPLLTCPSAAGPSMLY